MNAMNTVKYTISADNRITNVNSAWDEFCFQNETPELRKKRVLGQPLYFYIHDTVLAELYKKLIDTVRKTQAPLEFPYRCDSPNELRYMHMRITPVPEHEILFESCLVGSAPRHPAVYYKFVADKQVDTITFCSVCNKVKVLNSWYDLTYALTAKEMFNQSLPLRFTAGICKHCSKFLEDIFASRSLAK
jgi:hypothetical protein